MQPAAIAGDILTNVRVVLSLKTERLCVIKHSFISFINGINVLANFLFIHILTIEYKPQIKKEYAAAMITKSIPKTAPMLEYSFISPAPMSLAQKNIPSINTGRVTPLILSFKPYIPERYVLIATPAMIADIVYIFLIFEVLRSLTTESSKIINRIMYLIM